MRTYHTASSIHPLIFVVFHRTLERLDIAAAALVGFGRQLRFVHGHVHRAVNGAHWAVVCELDLPGRELTVVDQLARVRVGHFLVVVRVWTTLVTVMCHAFNDEAFCLGHILNPRCLAREAHDKAVHHAEASME